MKTTEEKSLPAKIWSVVKVILDGLIISIFLAAPVILVWGAINAIFGIDSRDRIGIGPTETIGLGSDFGLILRLTVAMVAFGAVLALIRHPKTIWNWLKPRWWAKWGLVSFILLLVGAWLFSEFQQTPAEKLATALNGDNLIEVRELLEDLEFEQDYLDLQFEGAVRDRRFDAAMALVEAGANVDQYDNSGEFTLLETAVLFDDFVTIIFLIDQGADLGQTNSLGDTPMMTLIEFRLSKENMTEAEGAEIVRAMLAAGADPSHKNDFGQTARDYAEQRNYGEILGALP